MNNSGTTQQLCTCSWVAQQSKFAAPIRLRHSSLKSRRSLTLYSCALARTTQVARQSHTLHAWLRTLRFAHKQSVRWLSDVTCTHGCMHTYIVFAGIFSLLVARHHNVDNLGSLAWSSPRHLAGTASLCFFFMTLIVFTNEFVRLLKWVQRKSKVGVCMRVPRLRSVVAH